MMVFNFLRRGQAPRGGPRSYGASLRLVPWLAVLCASCIVGGAADARPIRLVAFGDSLMAGFMLPNPDGFAPRLEDALKAQGHDVVVVNAGVSGDTTTGGLARLDWTLADGADAVILELGANDMLRGIDPKIAKANLATILAKLQARHIKVLLAGMRAAPSLGKDYAEAFNPIYGALAATYHVPLYPFFLEGILGDAAQHLSDGLHPNQRGVKTIVANILPSVDALLKTLN